MPALSWRIAYSLSLDEFPMRRTQVEVAFRLGPSSVSANVAVLTSQFGGSSGPVPSRTQGRLPDRARLWLGRRSLGRKAPMRPATAISPLYIILFRVSGTLHGGCTKR